MACDRGVFVETGKTLVSGKIGLLLKSVNLIHLPGYAVLEINGTEYTVQNGAYVKVTEGKVGVLSVLMTGACIDIQQLIAVGQIDSGSACGATAKRYISLGGSFFVSSVDLRQHSGCGPTAGKTVAVVQGSLSFSTYADSPWEDLPAAGMDAAYIRARAGTGNTRVALWDAWVYTSEMPGGGAGGGGGGGGAGGDGEVVIPPAPALDVCDLPAPSLSIGYVIALLKWIGCTLKNILAQLAWIISVLVALIPKVLQFLVYVLTLQWLEDWVKRFFQELDVWISNKFGVDPDKPLLDELAKRLIGWFFSLLDAKADEHLAKKR